MLYAVLLSLLSIIVAPSWSCDVLESPDATFQVAWISKTKKQANRWSTIEVVPFTDLQKWKKHQKPDTLRLLQYVGMKRSKAKKQIDPQKYKIVVMTIHKTSLCRPMLDEKNGVFVGSQIEDVVVCKERRKHKPMKYSYRHGDTGCGYLMDSKEQKRSLDVYRIHWLDAASQGFLVVPMEHFLK